MIRLQVASYETRNPDVDVLHAMGGAPDPPEAPTGTPAVVIISPPRGNGGDDGTTVHNVYIPVRTPITMLIIVAAISSFISGGMALIGTYYMGNRVQELHLSINSKMDRLLQLNAAAAFEKGQKAGVIVERNYQNDQDRKDASVNLKGEPGRPGPTGQRGKPGPQGPAGHGLF